MKKQKYLLDWLDPSSVERVFYALLYLDMTLDTKIEMVVSKMAERGVEISKRLLEGYDGVLTADLLNSIHKERRGDTIACVVADSDHAIFVEFGTGQKGEESPYKYGFPDGVSWEYNVGETIFEIKDGQYGWYYPNDRGGWSLTQGMPSRPFMYETALELPNLIREVAKEIFDA